MNQTMCILFRIILHLIYYLVQIKYSPLLVCFGLEVLEPVSFNRERSKPLMEQSIPVMAHSCSWYSNAAFSNLGNNAASTFHENRATRHICTV